MPAAGGSVDNTPGDAVKFLQGSQSSRKVGVILGVVRRGAHGLL